MPTKSERQRKMMAMCAHGGRATICKKLHKSMTKSQMRDFSFKKAK